MNIHLNSSQQSFNNSVQNCPDDFQTNFITRVKQLAVWFKQLPTYQIKQKKQCPPYDINKNYYQQFWRTYLYNEMIIQQIKQISSSNKNAAYQIQQLQEIAQKILEKDITKKKKKNRRPAIQISKNYKCPYQNCYKSYGSDVSMNLHIKIKHDGGNKTDREKLAKQIIIAQKTNQPVPEVTLNFPPRYLDEYRLQMISQQLRTNNLQSK